MAARRRYRTPRRVDMSAGRGRDEPRIEIDHPLEAVDGHMLVGAVDHPGLLEREVHRHEAIDVFGYRLHSPAVGSRDDERRPEEHTYELQSLMRNSHAVFSLQKKT